MLCITIPSISAYLTTSESKDSTFTIAKQESFTLNPDDGSTPEDGDECYYGDYTYTYSESDGGWDVALNWDVTSQNQTSYGPILESINGKPITNMAYTFENCLSLITAPAIPASVTNMNGTFSACTSLTTAPVISEGVTNMKDTFCDCVSLTTAPIIPDSVTNMEATFSGCEALIVAPILPSSLIYLGGDNGGAFEGCKSLKTYAGSTNPDGDFSNYKIPNSATNMCNTFYVCYNLTNAPKIPESVTDLSYTFDYCSALTGEIEINADPSNYDRCFAHTEQPIVLTGTSAKLAELAATATNGNVTVQPEG